MESILHSIQICMMSCHLTNIYVIYSDVNLFMPSCNMTFIWKNNNIHKYIKWNNVMLLCIYSIQRTDISTSKVHHGIPCKEPILSLKSHTLYRRKSLRTLRFKDYQASFKMWPREAKYCNHFCRYPFWHPVRKHWTAAQSSVYLAGWIGSYSRCDYCNI